MATPPPSRRRRTPPASATSEAENEATPRPHAPIFERGPRHAAAPEPPKAGRFPTEAVVWTFLLTGLSYATGWYIAYMGILPIFLASEVGLAALFTLALRTCGRIVRSRIPIDGIAIPGAAVAKAAAWALAVFWFFATLTNVLQLAIGLGGGILAYQLFTSKARLEKEGYGHATRFGPAFFGSVFLIAAYVAWFFARRFFGAVPGFDIGTIVYGVTLTIIAFVATDRRSRSSLGAQHRHPSAKSATDKRRNMEKRTIAFVVIGYLFFRFFISSAIPYGPIVEWFLVCVGALFVAIVMADRIGVVPTRRSLPHPDARVHIQRIHSLPDRSLEEADQKLDAFLRNADEAEWVAERFRAMMTDAGVPAEEIRRHLADFHTPKRGRYAPVVTMGLEARERLIHDLLSVLRARRGHGPTGTLKTAPAVRTEDKGIRPIVAPAP